MSGAILVLARKEARALMPTLAAAAAATVISEMAWSRLGLVAYAFGAFTLGAQSVGHEYGYRTISALLVQPIDRRRIYAIKLTVLALTLAVLAGVAWLSFVNGRTMRWDRTLAIALPPLGAMIYSPWLTMLCRHQLAGTVFTAVPAGLALVAADWIAYQIYGDGPAAQALTRELWVGAMLLLTPMAAVLGWRTFLTLEVIEGAGQPIQLPTLRRRNVRAQVRHRLWHSLTKELQLQQVTAVTVTLYVLGIGWAMAEVTRGTIDREVVGVLTVIYVASVALLVGSLSSAEERQLGTLESELMLPGAAWRQWCLKVTVSMALTFVAAVLLPAALLMVAPVGIHPGDFFPQAIGPVLTLTAIGIYVSSLSSNGVRAMIAALPVASAALVFGQSVQTVASAFTTTASSGLQHRPEIGAGFLALFVMLLLWMGFQNHRSLERSHGRVLQQVAALLAVIAGGVLLS